MSSRANLEIAQKLIDRAVMHLNEAWDDSGGAELETLQRIDEELLDIGARLEHLRSSSVMGNQP